MMRDELRGMIEGMSVSVDVSTGDHDAGRRYFGTVTEVMDDISDKYGVTLLVQDAEGKTLGGLLGLTFWGWLFIDWLWLSPELRGKGYGGELLTRAEAVARDRGCTNAYTDTFSFQAPGFWQRNGYVEFGRLDGMPAGHARVWFRKAL